HKGFIGNSDLEIRFEKDTTLYSGYYPFTKIVGTSKKILDAGTYLGNDKLPLSVWQINDPSTTLDDKRLYLKVYDGGLIKRNFSDSFWSNAYIDSTGGALDSVLWEKVIAFPPLGSDTNYVSSPHIPLPLPVTTDKNYRMGFWLLSDKPENKPQPGTVIKVNLWKSLTAGDKMTFVAVKPLINNKDIAAANLANISVYPNPYYGIHKLENGLNNQWVQFTNLPPTCTIRIYSLSGEPVRKIDRTDAGSTFQNWDLRNNGNQNIASGMYIVHVDIPGVGTKVLKLAVAQMTR
ncbi:MAG: T9SS type A sorting domain-containing protein, partial [Ignavibacteriales bacterium]|nr:T9SS type A sorting domain-containing protein [Ignavibacteriales bacterium]